MDHDFNHAYDLFFVYDICLYFGELDLNHKNLKIKNKK